MRRLALVMALAAAACGGDEKEEDPHVVRNPRDFTEDRAFVSPPTLQYPIYACAKSVVVKNFIPGAKLDVFVDGNATPVGSIQSWLSGGQNIIVSAEFAVGQKVTARQTFDGATSDPSNTVTVTSHTEDYPGGLPQPRLAPTPCHECGRAVGIADAVPGALVQIFAENPDGGGGFEPAVEVGSVRDFGYAFVTAFEEGARVWAKQTLCTDESPRSDVVTVQAEPPIPAPTLDPVHQGVNIVTLWGPGGNPSPLVNGATLDVFADNQPPGSERVGGQPTPGGGQQVFIDPVAAAAAKYSGSQTLCTRGPTSAPVEVVPCADQPPAKIKPPIPGDTQIELTEYIPGARILVFVNGEEWGDGGPPTVNLKDALSQGDQVVVLQRIGTCDSRLVYQITTTCALGGDDRACSKEWPAYRHNGLRNAHQPIMSALADPYRVKQLNVRWEFPAPAATEPDQNNEFNASPVVHDGRVFVGNANGHMYALDAATGAKIWEFPAPGAPPLTSRYLSNRSSRGIASGAAIATGREGGDMVIFGAPDRSIGAGLGSGRLFALNAQTGAVIWRSPELARLTGLDRGETDQFHEQLGYSAPLVLGDRVYIGIADHGDNPIQNGRVVAVRLADGQPVAGFSFVATGTRGGGVWSSVAGGLTGGALYVTTGNVASWNVTEPNPNHGLSMLRLDPNTGAVVWKLQPVPFALDGDPDWANGPSLVSGTCGELSVSTMKDGWTYASRAASGSALADVRWQFPPTGFPFTVGDGTVHGDSRYLRPGAAWGNAFITMAGGEMLTLQPMLAFDDPTILPGFGQLHALNVCAGGGSRVRWIADVPNVTANAEYQFGPPTVSRGIVYVGTAQSRLIAIADPSVWPTQGSRCARTDVSNADCAANNFPLVPRPSVLRNVALNRGNIQTEPALAGGRVFVSTRGGWVVMLEPTP